MILGCLWRAGAVNVSPRGFVCGAGAVNVSPRGLECCFFLARDGAGLVREIIRPARLVGDKSGTKFSQQEQNAPNGAILDAQGEFCIGNAAVRLALGEFFRASRRCTQVLSATRHRPCCRVWGFCSIRSWLAACRRRVRSLMMQFPRRTAVSPRLEVLWSLNRKPPR